MRTLLITLLLTFSLSAFAAPPKKNIKSKFYDFQDQLIDGHIKQPIVITTFVRQRIRFERLLNLKKSFIPCLFKTSKEKVFK